MKQFLSVAFCAALLFATSCKDEGSTLSNEGKITGVDGSLCACCGGWFLESEGVTYRFEQLPAGANIDLQNATFPLAVTFEYQTDPNSCSNFNRIIVTDIEVQ
jgi:hypothetical protein